ncbi:disease resistance protein RGA4 [Populus alba x Populus x berolinensis]|nr:disease resistance protein RGA4 [Populus alba x Populus x berolinensis]
MAEALLSPILEQLTRIVAQQVREEVSLVGDVKKQVDKLKSNLLSIQSVLEDADRKQVKDKAVRDWVDKLKDVCYDMDDVLDEWSTAILRWKMEEAEENTRSLQKMRCSFLGSPCFCLNQVVRRRDIALKIKEVCEKVDDIAKARAVYGFELYRATDELQRITSTSLVDESIVTGRDDEREAVVSKLLGKSIQEAGDVEVISIVGMGGIGKTTLAQLAFNDAEVTAHFEKIWVCVSDPFDEGKRFLLVLDDVWTENHGQWEPLKLSLKGGAPGSRILVTSRKHSVATMMGTDHMINLDRLSDEVCMSIFNQVAFHKRSRDECERLTEISDKIASKCKGLPLAAKLEHVERGLFPPLLLSYYDLPSVVRRCFLYCAMFPKDYEMVKDELVKMWMAQGYLKETPSRDMELVGEEYFQVLAARSFFQDFKTDEFEGMKFKMHDIVHDFAQYMTKNECLTVDASKLGEATTEISCERVRHLSMKLSGETSFPASIRKAKGLRSLLIGSRDPSLGAALLDVFKQLTCIRSLNLSWSSIKEIPKEVGKLIHLRHLNLADCGELESLPETTCDLCNLQSLDVTWCRSLKELPKAIGKLIKLRHLQIYGSGVAFIPKGIERITCLRTLDVFTVCGGGENESKAANLRELKNLNHIGGSLIISNLGRGKEDASDAAEAQLKNKKRLLCLELGFDYNQENGILIEALQPPSDLEYLTISSYRGFNLPNWMMTLTRLQVLTLRYCENVDVLPPLGRLPNLERLVLSSLKVRRLDAGFLGIVNINEGEIAKVTAFPKLKELGISYLEEVEEWDGIERRVGEEDANTTSISIMPQLRELMIVNCPLLRALPDYVLAAPLQKLEISMCPILRKRYGKEMGEDWQKISHIPNIYFHDI